MLLALVLWQGSTVWWGIVSPARLPTPSEVWAAFQQIVGDGYGNARWHEHVLRSVRLVVLGFTVASSVGVVLGLAMGASRRVEALVNPVFLVLRPIPPLAWIPLAIVWLGLGDSAKLMVIFVSAFVPSVINSWTGVRQIDTPIFEAAAESHPDVTFAKIDTEAEVELATAANITSIPMLMAFRDGILVFAQPGALPAAALEELIGQVQGLDMDEVRSAVAAAADGD